MPFAADGTFTRGANSFSNPVLGTEIDPTDADTTFDGYDSALSTVYTSGAHTLKGNSTAGSLKTADLTVAQAQVLFAYPTILGGSVAVDFNSATTDFAITITCPTTDYRIANVLVINSGTTASLTTATGGLFKSTGASGAIAADQALSSLTSNAANTGNSLTTLALNALVAWFNLASVQFRVGTAQGAAATGKVYVLIQPLP